MIDISRLPLIQCPRYEGRIRVFEYHVLFTGQRERHSILAYNLSLLHIEVLAPVPNHLEKAEFE